VSDTSLVFNLVARDNTEQGLSSAQQNFDTAAAGIGAGMAVALGAGFMDNLSMEAANAKLAAQLALGPAEAAEVSKVSAAVYTEAWGDSAATVNEAIRGVYQNIGDVSAVEGGLESVTTKVLALAETFDQEVGPATAAVGQLIKTGLAADANEALDILTRGFQVGNDKAGDLLDTVNEYSTQWRDLGLNGEQAMGILQQGLQAGARDADIVADAMKELNIRVQDKSAAEALKMLGLNADDMAAKFAKGGPEAADALDTILDSLRENVPETERYAVAQQLLGTQSEDLSKALMGIDPSTAVEAMGEVKGSTQEMADTLQDSPAKALEEFKRKALEELGIITGGFLTFATDNQAVMEPLAYTLLGLATTVLIVKGAIMTYTTIASVVAGANAIINASTWTVIGNWLRMMGIGIMAYLRIAAGAVASALTTAAAWTGSALVAIGTWVAAVVRAALTAVAQFVLMAGRAIIWAATMAAQWLIAMGPVGWVIATIVGLVALIIANWDTVVAWTGQAWDWVWQKIQSAVGAVLTGVGWLAQVPVMVGGWFADMTNAAIDQAMSLVNWLVGLPGRMSDALGSMKDLLYNKGLDVVTGLWNGIKAMGAWLKDTLIGWAREIIPGPIADALGISSPSKMMAEVVGRWIPPGIVAGAQAEAPAMNRALGELVDPQAARPSSPLTAGTRPLMAGGAGGSLVTVRIVVDGPEQVKRLLRHIVAIDGGGNVQAAFGTTGS
jgi:phage-related minor tail protein